MILESKREEAGFNILELMVVVLILGIILTIAMATYAISVQNARTISCLSNQRILDGAANVYQAKTGERPTDIEELRPFANTFDRIIHCTTDYNTLLTWNAATEEIECSIHPR